MRARLSLVFEYRDGRTTCRTQEQQPPWKVVRAFPGPHGQTLVHLHNVSGGILRGDELDLHVTVEPGARVQITTTGATRLYKGRQSRASIQFHLGEGSLLEYLPDAIIPFRDSSHSQTTLISLERASTLFWWETVAPGREAHGEHFAYNTLDLCASIRSGNTPLLIDRMRLEPFRYPLDAPTRLGKFRHFAAFTICRPGEPDAVWRTLEETLRAQLLDQPATDAVRWGISALPQDGLAMRGLAQANRHFIADLHRSWETAKQFLCGHAAVPPRKLY